MSAAATESAAQATQALVSFKATDELGEGLTCHSTLDDIGDADVVEIHIP